MGDVHEQREAVAPRQLLREGLGPVGLDRDAHALHGAKERQQLRVRCAKFAPSLHDFAAQQLEQAAAQCRMNTRIDFESRGPARRKREPCFVSRGRHQSQQLGDLIRTGRARTLGPPREQRTNGVLENLASDTAGIRAEGMVWRERNPWLHQSRGHACWRHGHSTRRNQPSFRSPRATAGSCARAPPRAARSGARERPATPVQRRTGSPTPPAIRLAP